MNPGGAVGLRHCSRALRDHDRADWAAVMRACPPQNRHLSGRSGVGIHDGPLRRPPSWSWSGRLRAWTLLFSCSGRLKESCIHSVAGAYPHALQSARFDTVGVQVALGSGMGHLALEHSATFPTSLRRSIGSATALPRRPFRQPQSGDSQVHSLRIQRGGKSDPAGDGHSILFGRLAPGYEGDGAVGDAAAKGAYR
jgi:hypothetical protein